jgi:hypothetical protein
MRLLIVEGYADKNFVFRITQFLSVFSLSSMSPTSLKIYRKAMLHVNTTKKSDRGMAFGRKILPERPKEDRLPICFNSGLIISNKLYDESLILD